MQDSDKVSRVQPTRDVGGQQGGGMKALIIPLGISLAVTFVMLSFWAMPKMVSKDDFTKNIQGVQGNVDAVRTSLSNYVMKSDLNAYTKEGDLSEILAGYALKTELINEYATKADLASAKPDLSGYAKSSELTSLAKEADIVDLETRVKALEDKQTATPPPVSGQVTVSIDASTPSPFNGQFPYTLKINIANNTSVYQYVSYFVGVSIVTPTSLSISGATLTAPIVITYNNPIYIPTPVSPLPPSFSVSQILFTPSGKMLVPPGNTPIYYLLTISPSQAAVWGVSISNVTSSTTP